MWGESGNFSSSGGVPPSPHPKDRAPLSEHFWWEPRPVPCCQFQPHFQWMLLLLCYLLGSWSRPALPRCWDTVQWTSCRLGSHILLGGSGCLSASEVLTRPAGWTVFNFEELCISPFLWEVLIRPAGLILFEELSIVCREGHSASCGARGPSHLLAPRLLPSSMLSLSLAVSSSSWSMAAKGEGAVLPGGLASSWPSLAGTRPTSAIPVSGARRTVSITSTRLNLSWG